MTVRVTQLVAEIELPFTSGNETTVGTETVRVGTGTGSQWYLVPPVVDSGDELRSKVMKAMRPTGKLTNPVIKGYGYDVNQAINVQDLEDGTNSSVSISLSNTTQVTQYARQPVNVPNAVLHTLRLEGDGRGESTRDRIDEIVIEVADQGVRR